MRNLIFAIICFSLSGCGAAWHIKRAEKHIAKAEEKGAKWRNETRMDTVYKDTAVYIAGVEMDSSFDLSGSPTPDTIVITKDNIITKVVVNTVKGKAYVKTVKVPETKYVRVPVIVNRNITRTLKAGITNWQVVGLCSFFFVLAFMLGYMYPMLSRK